MLFYSMLGTIFRSGKLHRVSSCFKLADTCRSGLGATLAVLPSNIRNVKGHQGLKHWMYPWPSSTDMKTHESLADTCGM